MTNQQVLDFVDEFLNLTRTAANEEELRVAFVSAASFNTTAKYRKVAGEEHRRWYESLWSEMAQ